MAHIDWSNFFQIRREELLEISHEKIKKPPLFAVILGGVSGLVFLISFLTAFMVGGLQQKLALSIALIALGGVFLTSVLQGVFTGLWPEKMRKTQNKLSKSSAEIRCIFYNSEAKPSYHPKKEWLVILGVNAKRIVEPIHSMLAVFEATRTGPTAQPNDTQKRAPD